MEEAKKLLEEAIASSNLSNNDKGNILYLAESYADAKVKLALYFVAEYEATSSAMPHKPKDGER